MTVTDTVTTSLLARIATTAPSVGGADKITFGAGNNVVLGGAAGDIIKGADKGAVILGDNGVVTFDALGRILRAISTDTAVGGDDTIEIGDGDNVVLGGYGRDGITIGDGNNVVLGDSGQADFEAGAIVEIASTSPEVGDKDTIKLGKGRNTVIAGAGGDSVTAGDGANVVLGDAGYARFTATGLPIIVETTYDNVGGSDVITVGNGDSVILGGSGGDVIEAGDGRAVVLGDNGQATFDALGRVVQAATTAATSGARDEITLGNGGSVVIGGVGADKIVTGSGADVILGDNGSVIFRDGVLISLETLESTFGLGDLIQAGEGDNVVFGGVGADDITTGSGADVILGDDGQATFTLGKLVRVTTKNESVAGDDTIRAGDGANVVLGGSGHDAITTGLGDDVVFGDNGAVDFVNGVRFEALSERAGGGGRDTIVTGAGADLVIGGLGADSIDAGKLDGDDDIVFGDNGHVTFDVDGRVTLAETMDATLGGDDIIETGAGKNIVLGGAGSDKITTGKDADVVLGDNGAVTFSNGIRLEATSDRNGGAADTIVTGAGADLVIGGLGGDSIDAGRSDTDEDIVFGDGGHVTFDVDGVVTLAETMDATLGGDDSIDAGAGANIVLGGAGSDRITTGAGADIVLGDNGKLLFAGGIRLEAISDRNGGSGDTITTGAGADLVIGGLGADTIDAGLDDTDADIVFGDDGHVVFDTRGRVKRAESLDLGFGDDDTIVVGGGDNLVIAGTGADRITARGGNDTVLGDEGRVTFETDGRVQRAESFDLGFGGNDEIDVGAGDNIVIAGVGSDVVTALGGSDVVIGDGGYAVFDAGVRVAFVSTDTVGAGNDRIDIGDGDNLVIGGSGGDSITTGEGADIILGDNGSITFAGGTRLEVTSDRVGGAADIIKTGSGADLVLGGLGGDSIDAGATDIAADIVLGDNGRVTFDAQGGVSRVESLDPGIGGNDTIDVGGGDNLVIGGTGSDVITALGGSDVVIGDGGYAVFEQGVRVEFASSDTNDGGNDRIQAGGGDNLVIGGSGSDTITTAGGADIVLGDNGLVAFELGIRARVLSDRNGGARDVIATGAGADLVLGGLGSDTIDAGKIDALTEDTDADVVFGDDGQVTFDALGRVRRAESLDTGFGGDDEIHVGGTGSDVITALGGSDVVLGDQGYAVFEAGVRVAFVSTDTSDAGNDRIDAGDGDNLVIGGSGGDSITTGEGADIVLGDNGRVDYALGIRSIVQSDRNGGARDILSTGAGADVVVGGLGADSIDAGKDDAQSDVVFGDNGRVTFDAFGLVKRAESLDPTFGDDDTIEAGGGDNVIIGGTGTDTITALGGNDVILGDNGYAIFQGGVRVEFASTDPDDGARDVIKGGDGNNIVIGSVGADDITTGSGADILLGDMGVVRFEDGLVSEVYTTEERGGPGDVIKGGDGDNIVFGGAGRDEITTGAGADLILGDFGEASFTDGHLVRVASLYPTRGDDDTITAGDGANVILGGFGSDTIVAGAGADVVLGDHGLATFQRDGKRILVRTTDPEIGAADRITLGDGDNLALGGAGADVVTAGAGADVIVGDHGSVSYDAAGLLAQVLSSETGIGGSDTITAGNGNDVIVGGFGSDAITAGDGAKIVLGDSGRLDFTAGVITLAQTLDASIGDIDTIKLGTGNKLVLGGAGSDRIEGLAGDAVVLGDAGLVRFVNGKLVRAESTDVTVAGDDTITLGAGNGVMLGGSGADTLTLGAGRSVVLGDNGTVDLDDQARATEIASTWTDIGARDVIVVGDGGSVVIGGFGADLITTGSGADIILGDNGAVTLSALVPVFVRTTSPTIGAADEIRAGEGDNVVLGGAGADLVVTGSGADVIVGDHGSVSYDAAGLLAQVLSSDTGIGGNDTVTAGNGNDVIVGGFGSDAITAGDGAKIVLGDSGRLDFTAGVVTLAQTLDAAIGDVDTIKLGTGNKLVLGGAGSDRIEGIAGDAVVLGDAGLVRFVNGKPVRAESTDVTVGGDDVVTLGAGNGVVLGGSGADTLTLGAGRSVVLGDNGTVDLDDQARATEIDSTAPDVGGRDVIVVGDGGSVVIGGFGADLITTGSGADIILGDNGAVTLSALVPVFVRTTSPAIGGADEIRAGEGDNVVLGGVGGDLVVTGSGRDAVLGDNGQIRFDAAGLITRAESLDTAIGGDDTIEVGAGDNLVIAGVGADKVTALGGDDIVLGDNGIAEFSAGVRVTIATLAAVDGGKDTLTLGEGNNLALGGAAADVITAGAGADVIVGDHGSVSYDAAGLLAQVLSSDAGIGGNDTIAAGNGNDVIVGGFGSDAITAGDGAKIVLGDSGRLDFTAGVITLAQTLDAAIGDVDTIKLGTGNKLVLGGAGGDKIEGLAGDAVVLGDAGLVRFANGKPVHAESTDVTVAGDDVVTLGAGNGVVLGGSGADTLTLGSGRSVVLGDNGTADLDDQARATEIASTAPDVGGRDVIVVGDGGSVVIGGFGVDLITTGSGADIILGDNGAVTLSALVPVFVRTTSPAIGGTDEIRAGEGDNVVLGGAAADLIVTGSGRDAVLGDNGQIRFDAAGLFSQIVSVESGIGGDDTIDAGAGDNVTFGGAASDTITTGGGADVILGDSGEALYEAGRLTLLRSLDAGIGGKDTIKAGNGNNIVLGGMDADGIETGSGADIVLGDSGLVRYASSALVQVASTDTALGGDDTVTAGEGDNLVIGGAGSDAVTTGSGADLILGDGGEALFELGRPALIRSLDAGIGGKDTIKAGEGSNIVIGGMDADSIETGSARDIVLGDSGLVRFDANGLVSQVASTDTALGGGDVIEAGEGDNLVLGGVGSDTITVGSGADIVLGDNGDVRFAVGIVTSITTIDATSGAGDTIHAGNGDNLVFGGLGGDTITTGLGNDVIVGDDGRATFSGGVLAVLETIDPTVGGDDTITAGDGDNLVFGGVGADKILTGTGADMIFGDNARAELALVGGRAVVRRATTTDPLAGGDDRIEAGDGNDTVSGGTGADVILGGGGHDVLFGDHMLYDLALPVNQRAVSVFTAATDGGGNDTVEGGAGDDFLYGQQGDDTLDGGAGDDDITGGHNVLGGADGNDTLIGGTGADVILGDNGVITRNVLVDDVKTVTWQRNPGSFADTVMRDVLRFDLIDFVAGNDTLDGGAGDDRLFGQMGDDRIAGGDGSDEIVGGLGRDTITGGAGVDYLLGDEGRIVRAYRADGSAVLNTDGTWHRDVVLEEIGSVTGSIDTGSAAGAAKTADLAAKLAGADLVLAVGAGDKAGTRLSQGASGSGTAALTVSLAAAYDDAIDGGDGNDVLFGQRGNDTLRGGAGDDLIYGDRASNLSETLSDQPGIVNAVRLIGAAAETGIVLPLGGEVVVPAVNLVPAALGIGAPRIDVYPAMAGVTADIAGADPIRRSDGGTWTVYASLVPSLYNANGVLAGNDAIDGGAGNDTIYGDSGETYTLDVTAYAALNRQIDKVSASLQDLLGVFASLDAGVDMLKAGRGQPSAAAIAYGNDTITGGDGDDIVVGDAARTIVRGSGPLRSLSGEAAASLSDFLSDMRSVVTDLAMTGRVAQAQVTASLEKASGRSLNEMLVSGLPETLRTKHTVSIGNDVIDAGAGNDLAVGDTLVMLQPGVARGLAIANPATAGTVASIEAALVDRAAARFTAMLKELTADFPVDRKAVALDWIAAGNASGNRLERGNDRILGGTGNDTLVGDTALIQVPSANAAYAAGVTAAGLAEDRAQVSARVLGTYGIGADLDPWTRSASDALAVDVLGWAYPAWYGYGRNGYFVLAGLPYAQTGWAFPGPHGYAWNGGFGLFNGLSGITHGATAFANGGFPAEPGYVSQLLRSGAAWFGFAPGAPLDLQPSSSVYASAVKAGEDIIAGGAGENRIFGSTATLVPAIDANGRMVGPNALTALNPTDIGTQNGSFSPAGYAASIGIITTAGTPNQILNYSYGVPVPGKYGAPSLANYMSTYGLPSQAATPYGYPYGAGPFWFGFAPFGTPQGTQTGPDQITEGGGLSFNGFVKKRAGWVYDAGVTLPSLSATTADSLSPTFIAGRPSLIEGVAHKPLLASDVIRSIQGGDILLRTATPTAAAPSKYRTWYFDEAKGSLVEQALQEDDILFLAKRFGDPTQHAK